MELFPGLGAARGALAGATVTIGNFDGLHVGHRRLVESAIADARARGAKATALTFRPHPATVLAPSMAPRLIATEAQTRALFEAAGIDALVQQHFDAEFSRVEGAAFEAMLLDGLGARTVVVGYDYTYGRRRTGGVETLRAACEARGARLVVVPPVTVDGLVASSTKVREFVLQGNVEGACRLLGRPFELVGTVVRGDGRGRTIGVPTANVAAENELLPGIGVYAVRARLPDGTWADGACNVGVNPTFTAGEGEREVSVEVHLIDRSVDLYGKRLQVAFVARLRAERRFPTAAALVEQIRADVEAARRALAPEAGR